MGHSLRMHCHYCKQEVEHRVEITDPRSYYKPIVKTFCGEDFMYRKRERVCLGCNCSVETVEMLRTYFEGIGKKLEELEDAKNRANYFKFQYDWQTKKSNNLQQDVDSLKKIIMDLSVPIQQIEKVLAAASIAKVLAAAPIEHTSSLPKNETYVDNKEKDDDDDNLLE